MPEASLNLAPNAAAQERLRGRGVAPTSLTSAQIERLLLSVREKAFFSAQVDNARLLQAMKRKIQDALDLAPEKAFADRANFVAEIRDYLGAAGGDSGRLTDVSSEKRLSLIYNHQVEDAYSRGRWARDNASADILDEFPAQELMRVETRKTQRDWRERWSAAGGKFYAGRMIARRDDPVWKKISRFGTPWPPFDYGSGMGVEPVSRDEAEALGVIKPKEQVAPSAEAFENDLAAEFEGVNLDPEVKDILAESLPPDIRAKLGDAGAEAAFRRLVPESISDTHAADYLLTHRDSQFADDLKTWGDDNELYKELMRAKDAESLRWRAAVSKSIRAVRPDPNLEVVYRGWHFPDDAARDAFNAGNDTFENIRPGMSASMIEDVAVGQKFTNAAGLLWEIRAPRTARRFDAIFSALKTNAPHEAEVIFPEGAAFRRVSGPENVTVTRDGKPYTFQKFIYEEVLTP